MVELNSRETCLRLRGELHKSEILPTKHPVPKFPSDLAARICKACRQWKLIVVWMGCFLLVRMTGGQEPGKTIPVLITNVAEIRSLTPEKSAKQLPVRLTGVITYFFDERACFFQDQTAGIFVGNGSTGPRLTPGDLVTVEGTTDSGEFAPIVQPSKLVILGHTNLPP